MEVCVSGRDEILVRARVAKARAALKKRRMDVGFHRHSQVRPQHTMHIKTHFEVLAFFLSGGSQLAVFWPSISLPRVILED